jgi:hypothetical protein
MQLTEKATRAVDRDHFALRDTLVEQRDLSLQNHKERTVNVPLTEQNVADGRGAPHSLPGQRIHLRFAQTGKGTE